MFRLATLLMIFTPFLCFSSGIISGHWSGADNNDDGTLYSTLTLKIHQSGNKISGQYCYVTQNGNRIDCPSEDERNLKGIIQGNKARVTFYSSFGGRNGVAELLLRDDKIFWKLKIEPKNGNFYAPEKYELTRQDDKKTQKQKVKVLTTKDFTVTLVSACGDFSKSCQDVEYYGMRNKDRKQITLSGHTFEDNQSGRVVGMVFANKDVEYRVEFIPLKLRVLQADKLVLEQDAIWQ